MRFSALLPVLPPALDAAFSLLDVGCGFADLYGFLLEAGYRNIDYTGIDIMPEFTDHAAARYPEATFVTGDFLRLGPQAGTYDFVLSSGALNLVNEQYPDHYDFVFAMVEQMYQTAAQGVAFNLLSAEGKRHFAHDERFFYCQAERVLEHCRRKAPATELDHGYLSYDFAIRSRWENPTAG
ncbi:class I SAM-dependent methyltransferase [Halochromatium salexigens]|nr:class I SAM-dependent methyltransferase [Halochromatium salexigens]